MVAERMQRDATAEMRLEIVRPQRQRAIEGGDGFAMAREVHQRVAAVEVRFGTAAMERQQLVVLCDRLLVASRARPARCRD